MATKQKVDRDMSQVLADLPQPVAIVDREDSTVSYFRTEAEAQRFASDWPADNSHPKQSKKAGYVGLWYVCSAK